MKNAAKKTLLKKRGFAIGSLLCVGFFMATQAKAGPVTGGANNPPYVETAVYQGVIGIVPGGVGDSIMEIGNLGQDISSSGDLYLRPGAVSGTNQAVRFARNPTSGKTDLHVYSRICLAGSCLDAWPTLGGTSHWVQSSTWLQPATASHGVFTNTNGNGFSPSIEVFGDHPDAAVAITKTTAGGNALEVRSYAEIYGYLDVTGAITMLECPPGGSCWNFPDDYSTGTVWHPGNDGIGSTLDASKLDGYEMHIYREPYAPSPQICGGATSSDWCICGEFESFGGISCLDLP